MTQARSFQISLTDTNYYHLVSRCIRHAFLCGKDNYTKKSYEHRRQWMVDRIRFLSSIFAIEVKTKLTKLDNKAGHPKTRYFAA